MNEARRVMIGLIALLLAACSASQSICRGPLHPINVGPISTQEPAP